MGVKIMNTESINKEVSNWNNGFKYRLLGRLKSDCEYFIDWRGRLWGGDVETHINYMIAVYNSLVIKPVWITMRDIKDFAARMH